MKHSDGQFKGHGGLNLYYQSWLPIDRPKAILLVVHGLAEHCGRYGNLVNYLVPRGYGIYGYDQRGHGKSDGHRGYVGRFSYFIEDLAIFLRMVRNQHSGLKIFIAGHSVGGTIATAFAILHQKDFDGLVLSGATLTLPADVGTATILAARLLSLIVPRAGLYTINAELISRDKSVVNASINDPLVYHGKIRARLGIELIKAIDMIRDRVSEIRLPILILHGAADQLSAPEGSKMLYEKTSSADKTLKVYRDCYHEIFNEPGHDVVLADVESWLNARL